MSSSFRGRPSDVARIVQRGNRYDVPFVPRGAGTSLAGGCLPVGGGVMIVLTRMKQILEINLRDRYAVVAAGRGQCLAQSGPQGDRLSLRPRSVEPRGLHDRRQRGDQFRRAAHAQIRRHRQSRPGRRSRAGRRLGRPNRADRPRTTAGLDLTGALVGSEGTLAIVTKVWVRLTRDPQGCRTMLGVFESVDDATNAISEIIGAGIIPAALEMMDQGIVEAVEQAFHFGFPLDAEAILLIEVDGLEAGLDEQRDRIIELCQQMRRPRSAPSPRRQGAAVALEMPQAGLRRDRPAQPQLLHAGRRRAAHQAAAHLPRDHRDRRAATACGSSTCFMPATATSIRSCCSTSAMPGQVERVLEASGEILDECIACGGSVTGEHGIGVEKIGFMRKLFTDDDLAAMERLRDGVQSRRRGLSPGKMLPTAGACGMEQTHPGRRAAV